MVKTPDDLAPGHSFDAEQVLAEIHLYRHVLHDLQSMLQGLLTDAEVLVAELRKTHPRLTNLRRDARDLLERVGLTVATLNNLRRGASFQSVEIVDLDSILREVMELLSGSAQQRSVRVKYDNTLKDRARARTSSALARQVVFNILDNAIKYSHHGEQGAEVRVSLSRDAEALRVRVQNIAPPIPRDEADKLFEIGYRGPYALSKASPGSGLGLYVAKQLLEKSQGAVLLDSKAIAGGEALITVEARFPEAADSRRAPSTVDET